MKNKKEIILPLNQNANPSNKNSINHRATSKKGGKEGTNMQTSFIGKV
jgi:hypothetical protein